MDKTKEIQQETIIPFSTGTGHGMWQDVNCECCSKCYQPPIVDGEPKWPCDKTMRRYVRDGRECPMKYALDMAWMDGRMPLEMAERVGYTREKGFPAKCIMWSDRGGGGNPRGPRRPRPVPDNQMVMAFWVHEIIQNNEPEKLEKVTV